MSGESADIQIPGPLGPLLRGATAMAARLRAAGEAAGSWLRDLLRRPKFRLAAAAALLLSPIPVYCLWAFLNQPAAPPVTLDSALAALDRGQHNVACRQAYQLLGAESFHPWNQGGPAYILGVAAAQRATRKKEGRAKRDQQARAAEYLAEAEQLGFPKGRAPAGLHCLGQMLIGLGRAAESIDVLTEALRVSQQAGDARRVAQIHKLLASAHRRLPDPQFAKALDHNAEYLCGPLSDDQRAEGLLERTRIQLALGRLDACRETLKWIANVPHDARKVQLIQAQMLMHEADQRGDRAAVDTEAQQRYAQAIELLKLARGRDTLKQEASPAALYLLGVCYERTGDLAAALWAFREVQKRGTDPHVALAARLRHAELLQQRDQGAAAEALFEAAAGMAGDPRNQDNPWMTRREIRSRLMAARDRFLKDEDFDRAVRLVGQFHPMFSREKQTRLLAETCQTSGERLRGQDVSAARAHFRRAGKAFYELARLAKATEHYPVDLWASIESYLAAADYGHAEPLLRAYLATDFSARDQPRALVRMAECQIARGKPREAVSTLGACFDQFPRDPFVYQARLLAARAHVLLGEQDQAEAMLLDNLEGGELAPASPEWRDSLFALGRLRQSRGQWSEAIGSLEEAVHRFPEVEQTPRAKYLLAESYRQRGREHGKRSKSSVEEERRFHSSRRKEDFESSISQLTEAISDLREEGVERSALAESTLRNARFALGATLFELGRYEEAVRVYASVVNRYPSDPAVLEAYVQIATALRQLNRMEEARNAILQARAVLENMPKETSFASTTKTSRQAWQGYLDWLARP